VSIRVRKLKDGSAVFDTVVDLGPDPATGKRRQERRTFKSKSEARAHERARRTEVAQGVAIARSRLAFGEYLATWLADVVDVTCERTTAAQYRWCVGRRLLPALGDTPLADVSTPQLQRWVADLARTVGRRGVPLSRRSVEEAYRIAHMALGAAARQRLVPRNPADGVVLPKYDRTPRTQAWLPDDAARFFVVAAQDAYEPLWTLAMLTGMRRAELLGLRWCDVDWHGSRLHIRRTRTKAGTNPVTKGTKSGRERTIPVPPEALTLLATHRERQALHIAECADAYVDQDLICCNPYGEYWYPDTVTARFKKLVRSAGVPMVSLHYTRHNYASMALRAGESLAAVSEVLGHADRETTLRVYQEVAPDQHRAVSDAVAGLLMSHSGADVTSRVTSKEEGKKKPAYDGGFSLGMVARPTGLEPVTFRSGI